MTNEQDKDAWSSDAYQKAASFVPKLATKVVEWLDVQPTDMILDIGCGDGVLTCQIAGSLTTGRIFGIDSSASMIDSARSRCAETLTAALHGRCAFSNLSAQGLRARHRTMHFPLFDKIFSNAALHWILLDPATDAATDADATAAAPSADDETTVAAHDINELVFEGVRDALVDGGAFVFEMGGEGNVAEVRAALTEAVARRVDAEAARDADPWFFPGQAWMREQLEKHGFRVERMELEARPTAVEAGGSGIDGWVRLMGSRFLDVVGEEGSLEREECVREVVERVEGECRGPDGGYVIGYVRLRVLARKVA